MRGTAAAAAARGSFKGGPLPRVRRRLAAASSSSCSQQATHSDQLPSRNTACGITPPRRRSRCGSLQTLFSAGAQLEPPALAPALCRAGSPLHSRICWYTSGCDCADKSRICALFAEQRNASSDWVAGVWVGRWLCVVPVQFAGAGNPPLIAGLPPYTRIDEVTQNHPLVETWCRLGASAAWGCTPPACTCCSQRGSSWGPGEFSGRDRQRVCIYVLNGARFGVPS